VGKPDGRKTAGLPLSVGAASLPVRLLLATIVAAAGVICGGGGWWIGSHGPVAARLVAIGLLVPFGIVALIAAAFIVAPFSRFGVWLDAFLPTVSGVRAIAVAVMLWGISAFCVLGIGR
jgi:hypothetical protein